MNDRTERALTDKSQTSLVETPQPFVIRESWWVKYSGLLTPVFLLPMGVSFLVRRSATAFPPMIETGMGITLIIFSLVAIGLWFVDRRNRDGVVLSVVDDILSYGPQVDSRASIPLSELQGVAWQNDRAICFLGSQGRFVLDFMFVSKADRRRFRRLLSSRLSFYEAGQP